MKLAIYCVFLSLVSLSASALTGSKVILNEYNSVSASEVLKNGGSDTFFGIKTGNGGDWFELIVVGDGVAGTSVDLRGWVIEVHETDGAPFDPVFAGEVIQLTEDDFFASVQVGTILTFTELGEAQGGLGTSLDRVEEYSEQGYSWSNIFLGDPAMVDQAASEGFDYINGVISSTNSVSIGGSATQFRVRDASGGIVMDVSGEGISPLSGVGSDEVMKLEANPSADLLPTDPNYKDGTTSTFGGPNVWSGGASRQSFAGFATGIANSVPTIVSVNVTGAIQGSSTEPPFQVVASDPEAGDVLTLSATLEGGAPLPSWMSFVDQGDRTAQLTLTPTLATEPGTLSLQVSVSDGSLTSSQLLIVRVFPATSPVVVNEYNAVDGKGWLRADDANNDGLPDSFVGRDSFFGTPQGNGGDWIELLVTGDGTAGSTVDMRGWSISVIDGAGSTAVIVLSDEAYWATVSAGTILTFIEDNSANGGLDTHINRVNRLSIDGYASTNIWLGDRIYVDQQQSALADGFSVNNDDTQITLRDAAGQIVAGPTGEGIGMASSVNGRGVFKLMESPGTANGNLRLVSGLTGTYGGDEFSSSFGEPNAWASDTMQQDLTPYKLANSAPVITSTKPPHTMGSSYRYDLMSTDADGSGAVMISAEAVPPFLAVTEVNGANGTAALVSTRVPLSSERGRHRIRLKATDSSGGVTPLVFDLWAVNPAPSVVLNEYNAVEATKYLGSSQLAQASEDRFFGKQQGNGGDWFELVVVADGLAGSTVDLRGWQIEFDTGATEAFVSDNTIKLSQNDYWASVPVGTFLTFATTRVLTSPPDKLNMTLTGSRVPVQDNSITEGYRWSHVWIGDGLYLEPPNAEAGYQVGVDDVITGIDINHSNTQFQIRDASGAIHFGPVGEGIAPVSGVNDESIVEYEGQLVMGISPFAEAKGSLDRGGPGYQEGYDVGAGGSSFGHPNAWRSGTLLQVFDGQAPMALGQPIYPIDGVSVMIPDWRVVLDTPGYGVWIASYSSLQGEQASILADPDDDGISNELEYLMGGDPTRRDGAELYGVVFEDGLGKLIYTERSPAIEGLALGIEWSTTLASDGWQDASGIWESSTSVPAGSSASLVRTTKVVDFDQTGSEGRVFLTFRVVR